MTADELTAKPLPEIPADIAKKIEKKNAITLTEFENKNEILKHSELQQEAGYGQFADGSYLVSMVCPMPGISADMIKWWFWWHPQDSGRYRAWFPGEHYSVSYAAKNKAYFNRRECPEFEENTQYPVERIGSMKIPLRIDFVTPDCFGFSRELMRDSGIELVVCGHVGAFWGAVPHTEMAHIFKKTDEGLFLISRFWLGKTLKNPLFRKAVLTDKTAKGMAEHCCVEYRNLAEILPLLTDGGKYFPF